MKTFVSKRIRPFLNAVTDEGAEITDLGITGHSHYKIDVTCKGKTRFFVAPMTAGDVRAVKNFRSDVRRWIRSISDVYVSN